MSRWLGTDRGAVEPLVALSGVLVFGLALSVYAVGLETALPGERDRSVAEPTLQAVVDDVAVNGVVRPGAVESTDVGPEGYRVRVELRADDGWWNSSSTDAPPTAETASRRVGVRTAPGRVVPGRLTVEVWTP